MHEISFHFILARWIKLEEILYLVLDVNRIVGDYLKDLHKEHLSVGWHGDICKTDMQNYLNALELTYQWAHALTKKFVHDKISSNQ